MPYARVIDFSAASTLVKADFDTEMNAVVSNMSALDGRSIRTNAQLSFRKFEKPYTRVHVNGYYDHKTLGTSTQGSGRSWLLEGRDYQFPSFLRPPQGSFLQESRSEFQADVVGSVRPPYDTSASGVAPRARIVSAAVNVILWSGKDLKTLGAGGAASTNYEFDEDVAANLILRLYRVPAGRVRTEQTAGGAPFFTDFVNIVNVDTEASLLGESQGFRFRRAADSSPAFPTLAAVDPFVSAAPQERATVFQSIGVLTAANIFESTPVLSTDAILLVVTGTPDLLSHGHRIERVVVGGSQFVSATGLFPVLGAWYDVLFEPEFGA